MEAMHWMLEMLSACNWKRISSGETSSSIAKEKKNDRSSRQ
jgi:hypothetical protein